MSHLDWVHFVLGRDYLFMYLYNIISSLFPRILVFCFPGYLFVWVFFKLSKVKQMYSHIECTWLVVFFPYVPRVSSFSSLRHYQLVMIKTLRQIILLEMLHIDFWSHSSPCNKVFFVLHCLLHKWPEFIFTQVFLCRRILVFSYSLSSLWSSCIFLQHENDRCVNAEEIFPF